MLLQCHRMQRVVSCSLDEDCVKRNSCYFRVSTLLMLKVHLHASVIEKNPREIIKPLKEPNKLGRFS